MIDGVLDIPLRGISHQHPAAPIGTAALGTGLLTLLGIGLQSEWRLQHTPPPDYRLYIAETQID